MTSGTTSFMMSANDIVTSALRQTGRFGLGDVIPPTDISNTLQSLNIIVKAMVKNQKPLWCVQRVSFPTVNGQLQYNLSTLSGTTRPLRALRAMIRDSTGNDTNLTMISRDDYNSLGSKGSAGIPNQAYYDPQLGAGMLYLYDVPNDARTIIVDIQRQVQDFNLLTDNPDFPQEAFHLLKWAVADEIALEYLTPQDMRQEISRKAAIAFEAFFANEREEVSSFFTPSERRS